MPNIIPMVVLLSVTACTKNYDNVNFGTTNGLSSYTYDWNKIADSSSGALNYNYWNASGYYNSNNGGNTNFGYWWQAHSLDVLVDAYTRTQSTGYAGFINNWYTGVKAKNGGSFIGQYYDDMGWIALALLRAYDATKDARFKTEVDALWTNIQTGWNTTMGGGIAWQKNQTYYKNSPANGPACILAARRYERFQDPNDLVWAKQIYGWWKNTLLDPGTGLVYDGINQAGDGKINTSWKFTYNQGVFIGAAIELYTITGDGGYLNDAMKTANYTINDPTLSPLGILNDEGAGDAGLFKGIFVRYFIQLILNKDIDPGYRTRFITYLKNNAETLWINGTIRPGILFGTNWSRVPTGNTDLSTELSGCMLLEGIALLKKNSLL